MHIDVAWSTAAIKQFRVLSHSQQQSARNAVNAIKISPRAAHYYRTIKQHDGTMRAVWVAYGLEVRILFMLAEGGLLHKDLRGARSNETSTPVSVVFAGGSMIRLLSFSPCRRRVGPFIQANAGFGTDRVSPIYDTQMTQ